MLVDISAEKHSIFCIDLNEWLDRFVSKHTTQMQDVASGVSRLQSTLGDAATLSRDPNADENPDLQQPPQSQPTFLDLLNDLRREVAELRERAIHQEAGNQALHMAVHTMGADIARLNQERHDLSQYR